MSGPLFIAMLKSHAKMLGGFIYGAAAYIIFVVWIYPSIANMNGLNDMISKFPKGMLKLIGMESGINSLGDYVAGEFYGILFLLILMIYVILTATRLMARLVDHGSMAYLLSTPYSRLKIAVTQAAVLITGLAVIVVITTLSGMAASEWLITGFQLDYPSFIQLNMMTFLIFLVIASYCFLFSSICNDEKRALGLSAGTTLIFYMLNMAGKLSDKTEWLLNFTIFKFYDPIKLMNNDTHVLLLGSLLFLASLVLFAVSFVVFKKRDLPL
jgi:ABC-2 type transport system permease protein